jgi:hypothetical protein
VSPAVCKRKLAPLGLHVAFGRDETSGWEFVVKDKSGATVAYGWSEGTQSDAADEVMAHPAIKMRLARAGVAP